MKTAIVFAILLGFVTPVLADEMYDSRMRQQRADTEYRMKVQQEDTRRQSESLQRSQRETQDRLDAQRRQVEQQNKNGNTPGQKLLTR